jgi:hypothetical protein
MSKAEAYIFLNGIERLEVDQQTGHYFVAHGYPEVEPDDYREHLQLALASEYQPVFANRHFQLKHILPKICELILTTDFGIYDISNPKKPNIFLELGIAIGLNKPIIITKCTNPQLVPQACDELQYGLQGLDVFGYQSYIQLRDSIGQKVGGYVSPSTERALADTYCVIGSRLCKLRGLIMPHRACLIATSPSDEDFRLTAEAALADYDLELVDRGTQGNATPEICVLCQQVQRAHLGIYNISKPWTPHIFLQLGMAIGFCRAWLLVLRRGNEVPSDLKGYDRIEFESFAILQGQLKKSIRQVSPEVESEQIAKTAASLANDAYALWGQEDEQPAKEKTRQCMNYFPQIITKKTISMNALQMFRLALRVRTRDLQTAADWVGALVRLYERIGLDDDAEFLHGLVRSLDFETRYQRETIESPL